MTNAMTRSVLITGAAGQLGWELQRCKPTSLRCIAVDVDELDVTSAAAIDAMLDREQPCAIINAAAYTAVDRAEQEPERAAAINATAVNLLATAAAAHNCKLIQISTDFVFDGLSGRPYRVGDTPSPQSTYGRTKLDGERAVLTTNAQTLILRTAWLYSSHGNNFVKTMLRLMHDHDSLSIVADQVGTPTWARGLAQAIWSALERNLHGIHHWTDAGTASWYDFAIAIAEEGLALGLLQRLPELIPIRTQDYPTPASRPPYSVLDKHDTWTALQHTPPHWRVQLRSMLQELKELRNGDTGA